MLSDNNKAVCALYTIDFTINQGNNAGKVLCHFLDQIKFIFGYKYNIFLLKKKKNEIILLILLSQ